ncbi:MAG: hypothetical protein HYZ53_14265 [Planctomycetes bacterium]|nr:hypothetical protein [Planctomycetota bacterium]
MNKTLRNLRHDAKLQQVRGQAMTEYIVIVSLVAIGCLMTVTSFGHQLAELFKRSTNALNSGTVQAVNPVHAEEYVGIGQSDRF